MSLPMKHTIAYRVMRMFYELGAMDRKDITLALDDEFSPRSIATSVGQMLMERDIIETNGVLMLSDAMRRAFDKENGKPVGEVAAPRDVNYMSRPAIHPSKIPTWRGRREGADDFMSWESKNAKLEGK